MPWWELEAQGYFLQGTWDQYRARRGVTVNGSSHPLDSLDRFRAAG